ncbi:MAG: hypothetical protein SW833_25815 [Cyanobacteriota bacterium]|nr:hypothetical protein [Cyanobacteriota bacterium]
MVFIVHDRSTPKRFPPGLLSPEIAENRQDFINLHSTTSTHAGIVVFKADRDYIGKVQTIHTFFSQDKRPMDNRLLRVMKQNVKGRQQAFIVREYLK